MSKKKQIIITDESYFDDLIWMSYRYCIGRKTIVAASHANDIALYSYKYISGDKKQFYAQDIRKEINDVVHFCKNINVNDFRHYIPEDAMSTLLYHIMDNPNENVLSTAYNVIRGEVTTKKCDEINEIKERDSFLSMYSDLIPWIRLANAFDINSHKTIVVQKEDGDIIEFNNCFSFPDYYHNKVKRLWTTLNDYLKNPYVMSCIEEKFIKEIK